MDWLFFAILAPAITSTVNFLDKYILKGQQVDYKGMPIFAATASVILGSLVWLKEGFPVPQTWSDGVVIIAGILAFGASVLYFKVVNSVAVSKILILFQLTPIFVLGLSFIILGERLNSLQIFGFVLVILAALGLTSNKKTEDETSGVPLSFLLLIIVIDLLFAIVSILLKNATETSSAANVYIFHTWGTAIGALILFSLYYPARLSFLDSIQRLNRWPLVLIFLNEGIFNLGRLFSVEATALQSVSLVNVVGSTQVFFGILYGWFLNKISPAIFGENSTREGLIKEVILATIMFVGVYLLY
jgi:drug/metabolite transporter (DMT)-like permease